MKLVFKAFAVTFLAGAMAVPVAADDPMQDLQACTKITKDSKRLACYDAVMKVDTTAADKASFGLNKPSKSANPLTRPVAPPKSKKADGDKKSRILVEKQAAKSLDKDIILDKDGDVKGVTKQVTTAKKDRNGRLVFTMNDRSVWRQTDDTRRAVKRGGYGVAITKTAVGSYILKPLKGSWSVRVKRIK